MLFRSEASEAGVRLIFSTHALDQARRLATEIIEVRAGEVDGPIGADVYFSGLENGPRGIWERRQ